jgi:hypothetical protein
MITEEQQELFEYIRVSLGAPIFEVELFDDQLCTLMKYCVKDYAKEIQNWLILNQWQTLAGKNVLNTAEMQWSLTMRSFDYAKEYSYYFSKDAGLQQRGPWELKKDYFTIEKGKQSYLIPAGREINKVLYVTPNTTDAALYANAGGIIGMGGFGGAGMAQVGGAAGFGGGFSGLFVSPAYDTALLSTDLNFKQRLMGGDLTYKVTGGPDGGHIIHLLSTPGSRLSFMFSGLGTNGIFGVKGCEVWYTYYDVSPENADQCRKDNKDVLLRPDQVPIDVMSYEFFNEPTKQTIAQLLLAKAKQTLGIIRGKFSGVVKIAEAEVTLDYQMLTQQGIEEYKAVIDELRGRLELLRPENLLKRQAEMATSLVEILKQQPMGMFVI